ncbi:hypothetical protein SDD30_11035 [Moorella naiadis]|uniref:hypothetical protein n=1 Tax=Moorella naiadis (nom. illeg.) TaxID=3093670 RepID=UPI003D9C7E57
MREELARLAVAEFQPSRAVAFIEKANIHAARAQEMLDLLAIHSLLAARAPFFGEGTLFRPVLREVESLFEDREQITVADVPAAILRPVAGELLFDCQVPAVGDKFALTVSRPLARAAMDAVNRLVDSMKTRRSDLRAATVLARLQRALEARGKEIRSI